MPNAERIESAAQGPDSAEYDLLDALYRIGRQFAEQSDLHVAIQFATDLATQLTHAEFGAFFYNVENQAGESYMLYTISGVPLEKFSRFPMPRNTKIFAPTFAGEGVVRSDDITKHQNYGQNSPHKGMPEGHLPVCSYLAVPVSGKNKEVLGGLFFGHPKPAIFTERAERIVLAIAAQAAIGIENFRLSQKLHQQTRTYETILSTTPDFVYIFDPQGHFTYANKSLLTMFGRSWDDTIGKTFLELGYEPWHADLHNREIQEVIRTKQPIRGEVPFTGTHGRRIYDYIFNPIFNAEGHVEAVAGITRDVTERKSMEESLRRNEERMDLALAAAEFVGIWDWDIEKDLVQSDERFARIYSVDPAKAAAGTPPSEFNRSIHPDDLPAVLAGIEKSLSDGSNFVQEHRIVQPDGTMRWVIGRGKPQRGKDGKFIRFAGTTIDITERKLAEEKLRASEGQFRLLADFMPQHIWTARPDGTLDYYNERCYAYTGIPRDTTDGETWMNALHPEDVPATIEIWKRSLETGVPYETQFRVRNHKNGEYRWFLVRALPMRDHEGNIIKWLGTNTDIEEQKQSEEMLIEARNAAEAANLAKTEFLANMSHEIRTPMNAVIGLSNILSRSSPLTPKQKEYIHTLQMSADSLLALINDLLDIAKIEARTVQLEEIPFNVTELVQEVISILAVKLREKNLNCSFDGECTKNITFAGDPSRLRQVIMNLCSNAVKFTESGSIHVGITSTPIDEKVEQVSIAVSDTGIGIAPDKLQTIFEKFVQADTSINRKYGGTGLGLAITKTLTEIMGGKITVSSNQGLGSTFTVTLPLPFAQSHVKAISPAAQDDARALAQNLRPSVLLVEDYAPNVMVAKHFLEEFGYQCDIASNGLEAVEKIKSKSYALVLMDVQMHGMNGLEATSAVRAHEGKNTLPRTPIIGMTAHALSGDRERCLSVGMDDYISKPFDPHELKKKMETLIAANQEHNA